MPSLSLATVYNCMENFVECGLVRPVNYEREPTRYCPNLIEHAHFYDKNGKKVHDIDLPPDFMEKVKKVLPKGFEAEEVEIHFRGVCKE